MEERVKENGNNEQLPTNAKLKCCAICGKQIAKSAKQCPFCGAKNRRPIIYNNLFRFVAFLIVLLIVINGFNFIKDNFYSLPESYKRLNYEDLLKGCMADSEGTEDEYVGEYYSISGWCNPYGQYYWSVNQSYEYTTYSSGYITTIKSDLTVYATFKSLDSKNNMPKVVYGEQVTVSGEITNVTYDYATHDITVRLTVYESSKD